MREIKFRGWDNEACAMRDWDYMRGYPPASVWRTAIFDLMQFTGFHDRSSKEVYDGDVVRVYDTNRYCICDEWDDCGGEASQEHKSHGEHRHEAHGDCDKFVCTQQVKWTKQGGYFCEEDTGDFCPPLGADEIQMEVLGNIYENPELLN